MANSTLRLKKLPKAIKILIVAVGCLAFQSACAHNQPEPNEAIITNEFSPFTSFVSVNTPFKLIDIESIDGSFFAMAGDTGARLNECDQPLYRLCLFSTIQKIALFMPIEVPEADDTWRFESLSFFSSAQISKHHNC